MTDRERLIDLLDQKQTLGCATETGINYIQNHKLADYLIAHGVIVPPCNVGDTVYHLYPKQGIKANKVKRIQVGTYGTMIADRNGVFRAEEINKTVFLTREEAERALKEQKKMKVCDICRKENRASWNTHIFK